LTLQATLFDENGTTITPGAIIAQILADEELSTAFTYHAAPTLPPPGPTIPSRRRSKTTVPGTFPSMSFPQLLCPQSPKQHLPHAPHDHNNDKGHNPHCQPCDSGFDDLSMFGNSTRFWCLVSFLSINLLLPFVNTMMLRFGESFAKTVPTAPLPLTLTPTFPPLTSTTPTRCWLVRRTPISLDAYRIDSHAYEGDAATFNNLPTYSHIRYHTTHRTGP